MTATKVNETTPQQPIAEGAKVPEGQQKPEGLEELAQYVRKTLPQPNTIVRLDLNTSAGVIQCQWQTRQFIVKPSLEVFELKRQSLYVTGASILVQAVLAKQKKNTRVFDEVVLSIKKVEELLQRSRTETALALLKLVKHTMRKQFGSRPNEFRMLGNIRQEKAFASSNTARPD
jgi:hypothetical protein